jgi:major membrane immunogen (membrane-anchored lipoprotein)
MKNLFLKTLVVSVIAITFCRCSGNAGNKETAGTVVNQNLFALAKEINKKCPMATDENTRMDSATVFNEYMITYHYTVHTVSSKNLDLAKFKASMQSAMDEKYKTDPQLKIYRDNKITIAYDYKDKAGNFLCYFIVGQK